MIKKVVIANRGEIALRIIRTLKDMGIKSVALYSEVDRNSRHTRMADEAYYIGRAPSSESYLNISKIIEVAKRCKADAIHPGYGFLSENSQFAKKCEEEGIIFIGPPSYAIEAMGEKTKSRKIMTEAKVPVVPGTLEPLCSFEEAKKVAKEIGYPIMLKASAGGGGKGMRLVKEESQLKEAFESASSEALSSFKDSSIYMEKAIEKPRHIEMQILADNYGNTIYLGERECSMQRRHQKVIEESPSVIVDEDIRQRMGEVAVRAAKAVGYANAGTVEFLMDENKNFYFMEMNTRLQVEHPVTELVTGLDLVWLQVDIASGKRLEIKQEDVQRRGWAIECRVYAEDPTQNFMPSPGIVTSVRIPEGPRVRVDTAIYPGEEVTSYYDPLIAKVITWGSDRKKAISAMKRALKEFTILGLETNKYFLEQLVGSKGFESGDYDTSYIGKFLEGEFKLPEDDFVAEIAALLYAYEGSGRKKNVDFKKSKEISLWRAKLRGF